MFFHVVVFSKSMSCKYFHVRSNLGLNGFECLLEKKLFMLKEIKYQKFKDFTVVFSLAE